MAESSTGSGSTSGSGSSSGSSSGLLGSACVDTQTPDPCADAGYACSIDNPCVALGYECLVPIGPVVTSCQLPGEQAPCSPSVGCAPPFACINGKPLTGNPGYFCLQSCTTSASCTDPFDICELGPTSVSYCLFDFCGPTPPPSTTSSGPAYYAPCNAQGTNDGTCLPWYTSGTIGFCQQAGTAPLSGPCDPSRDGGLASQCPLDTFCVLGTDGVGFCAPMCAPSGSPGAPRTGTDAGFTGLCAGGATCVATDNFDGSVIGACLASCGLNMPCTGSLRCQDGVCLP